MKQTAPALWLLAIAAVLGLGLANAHLLTAEIDVSPIVPPAAAGDSGPQAVELDLPDDAGKKPLQAFPESLARPLFRASRRPPEPAGKPQSLARQPAAKSLAPLPEDLELVGIMKDGGRGGRALIRLGAATGQWVEVGHRVQGWRLSQIDAGSVLFEAEGRQKRLALFRSGK